MPPNHLVGTVERYNAGAATGDDDFAKASKFLTPITRPPFFGAEVRPATVCFTACGLRIDAETRVLDDDGRVVSGLFAVGECTGSVVGELYMGSGNSLSNGVTMGRVAGRTAATRAAESDVTASMSATGVPERAADRDGWGEEWDRVADVVVVGSGVAAQGAALAAALDGSSVIMLEKAAFTGGTTGKSGGVLWIPNNPLMRARGLEDGRSDALRYLARVAYPTLYNPDDATLGLPPEKFRLLEVFYDTGSLVVEALTEAGALDVELVDYPDYYADLPEDTAPMGRTLQPRFPAGWRRGIDPSGGQLLVDGMQRTAEGLGVDVLLGHRAVHLVRNDDLDVVGLEVQVGKRTELVGARQAVIFGSGGFLHNPALTLEYLRGPVLGGGATEACTGDFVDIGIEVGAQLGNMSHAWWDQVVVEQAVRVPETSKDVYEPFGDSMLIVDRYGRRVVNEKIPYNERAQVHFDWDPVRREYKNLLLFMVWDAAVAASTDESRFRFPVPPPGETYDFVISAPTFAELSSAIEARLVELEPHTGGFTLDASFAAGLGDDRGTVQRHGGRGRRPRLRPRRDPDRAGVGGFVAARSGQRLDVPAGVRRPVLLRDPRPRRTRHQGRPGDRRVGPGPHPPGRTDRGPVRRRQLHRLTRGAGLLGRWRHDRCCPRLRLHRRQVRRSGATAASEYLRSRTLAIADNLVFVREVTDKLEFWVGVSGCVRAVGLFRQ